MVPDAPVPDRRIVTIDGPAGAGKSTVARRLADRLGMQFLDTGAMYRGLCVALIDYHVDPSDEEKVAELAERVRVSFNWSASPPRLRVDGMDVTHRLRDADVTAAVSTVATNSRVRRVLVRAQKWIGLEQKQLVTEGRDQGSVVFPDAAVKFYLDASPEVRARRRTEQLREAGRRVDQAKILREIRSRDQKDAGRSDGPLICPGDAIVIDSSDMSLDQVVDRMAQVARTGSPAETGVTG